MPHEDVDALMEEASARIVLPRFGRLASGDIDEKKANDFVTVADREAEEFLSPRLAALLPGARVLGEEAASADPSLMGRIAMEGLLWVVDPIDGTRSFIDGRDDFGIIVALLRDGETIGGWIMQPRGGRRLAPARGAGPPHTGFAPPPPGDLPLPP
ncbi:MAG: inositol monophosphatase family protein [Alphaproteobacteria bacterium]